MRLTTKGRYAVTALLDLAIQEGNTQSAVSLSDVAERQSISMSYLEQLFSKMRKAGLVNSTRGATGGYRLAKPLDDVSVMSIITAVDESVKTMQCDGRGDCQGGAMCLTNHLWLDLSVNIERYLQNFSLAEILHNLQQEQIIKNNDDESDVKAMTSGLFFNSSSDNPQTSDLDSMHLPHFTADTTEFDFIPNKEMTV